MQPELSFTYDANIRPIAGQCTACREQMPAPPSDPRDNVDVILWLSQHFLIHKRLKHPTPSDPGAADETDPFAE